MRTTLTIDDELYARIEEMARRQRRSVREVIDDLLRDSLRPRASTPYRVPVHDSPLRPGIDPMRLNQLADELDDEALLEGLRR